MKKRPLYRDGSKITTDTSFPQKQLAGGLEERKSFRISNKKFPNGKNNLHKHPSLGQPVNSSPSESCCTAQNDRFSVVFRESGLTCDKKIQFAAPNFHLDRLNYASSLCKQVSGKFEDRNSSLIANKVPHGSSSTVREKQTGLQLKKEQMAFFSIPAKKSKDSESTTSSQPRWPEGMQKIKEKIIHIPYVPIEREPLHEPTCVESQSLQTDTKERVVFHYIPPTGASFTRSCTGIDAFDNVMVPSLCKMSDTTLIFESRFESGNLETAVQQTEFSYDLYLREDLYCGGKAQWFYFLVKNTKSNHQYCFNIVNLNKPTSLYSCGMKPLIYSERLADVRSTGWHRVGENIRYYRTSVSKCSVGVAYTLSFTVEFPFDDDTVYFANCYPYTYSNLQEYLCELQNNETKSSFFKQNVLCYSLAGNSVPVLTITSKGTVSDDVKKRTVAITARVHPGETSASWVCKGVIDYLTGDTQEAEVLRKQFIFKIIPMLNPDGVIVGNHRYNLAGKDLNRQYQSDLKNKYPTIYHTKQSLMRLKKQRNIFLYCDIHGHSRKHNMFLYGCENSSDSKQFLQERIFPYLLKKYSVDKFSQDSSSYSVDRSREGTGRVVMWRSGVANSFTLEVSLGGCTQGKLAGYHFTTADFESMGKDFCEALLEYGTADIGKTAELRHAVELQFQQHQDSLKSIGRPNLSLSNDNRDSESSETESLSLGLGKLNLKPKMVLKKTRMPMLRTGQMKKDALSTEKNNSEVKKMSEKLKT